MAKHGEVDPRKIDKILGAANALANNLSLGFIPRGKSDDQDYQQGQQAGDDLSSALSTALMISGGGMILQGSDLVVSSPVLLALPGGGFVIAPGVAGVGAAEMTLGAGLAGYGSVVKQRVNNNNRLNFEGKGKGGGNQKPPENVRKLKNGQGWKDKKGRIWKKDKLHKDHWDVTDPKTGKKVKEVDFNGNQIWPDGPKNKGKS